MDAKPVTRKYPKVILYSTSQHLWEVWAVGRPIAHATTWEACKQAYPTAEGPSEAQLRLAREDQER
jgi:hypothetical protein